MHDCWNGYALVGYGNKQPYLRHRLDGSQVVCYLAATYYRQITLMWFLAGPVLTIASFCSLFASGGWLGFALLFLLSVPGWWAMVGSLSTEYLAVVDGDSRTVEVRYHKKKEPYAAVDFVDIRDIRVTSFYRQRSGTLYGRMHDISDCRMPVYRCTELALDLNDGRTLSLVESVDDAEVCSIEEHVTSLIFD